MLRRAKLTRKTPLRRSAWKRGKRKPNPAGSDPAHLKYIRSQSCCVLTCDTPRYRVQAHHSTAGGRGLGQKRSDHETMPLCMNHHYDFHQALGLFWDWDREKRRTWQREQVEKYRPKPAEESA